MVRVWEWINTALYESSNGILWRQLYAELSACPGVCLESFLCMVIMKAAHACDISSSTCISPNILSQESPPICRIFSTRERNSASVSSRREVESVKQKPTFELNLSQPFQFWETESHTYHLYGHTLAIHVWQVQVKCMSIVGQMYCKSMVNVWQMHSKCIVNICQMCAKCMTNVWQM